VTPVMTRTGRRAAAADFRLKPVYDGEVFEVGRAPRADVSAPHLFLRHVQARPGHPRLAHCCALAASADYRHPAPQETIRAGTDDEPPAHRCDHWRVAGHSSLLPKAAYAPRIFRNRPDPHRSFPIRRAASRIVFARHHPAPAHGRAMGRARSWSSPNRVPTASNRRGMRSRAAAPDGYHVAPGDGPSSTASPGAQYVAAPGIQ